MTFPAWRPNITLVAYERHTRTFVSWFVRSRVRRDSTTNVCAYIVFVRVWFLMSANTGAWPHVVMNIFIGELFLWHSACLFSSVNEISYKPCFTCILAVRLTMCWFFMFVEWTWVVMYIYMLLNYIIVPVVFWELAYVWPTEWLLLWWNIVL